MWYYYLAINEIKSKHQKFPDKKLFKNYTPRNHEFRFDFRGYMKRSVLGSKLLIPYDQFSFSSPLNYAIGFGWKDPEADR